MKDEINKTYEQIESKLLNDRDEFLLVLSVI